MPRSSPHARRRAARLTLATAAALCVCAFGASAAFAGDLDWSSSGAVTINHPVTGGSCPSTTLCVIGTTDGKVFISTNPTAGTAATWTQVGAGASALVNEPINQIACPSTTLCVAVDSLDHVYTSTNPSAVASSTWTSKTIDSSAVQTPDFEGISCPTTSLCVIVDNNAANEYWTTDPTDGATATWTKSPVPGAGALWKVSCASATQCTIVDELGDESSSNNPTLSSNWGTYPVDPGNAIYSIHCLPFFCVAGDNAGNVLQSSNPLGNAAQWHSTTVDSTDSDEFKGVACPSSSECLAADDFGNVWTSLAPSAAQPSWTATKTPSTAVLDGLSCYSASLCLSGDNDGDILLGTPAMPTVLTLSASDVTASAATLHGSVNPRGYTISSCRFTGGQSSGATNLTLPCDQTVGSGTSAVPVTASLSGLQANTTYYVRLSATNANGTSTGIEQSFTTPTTQTQIVNTVRPAIGGTPKTGSQLSCNDGTWTGNPTSYAITWERGLRSATTDTDSSWHAIPGASGATYTVQSDDEGSRVRCHVEASSNAASGEAVSVSLRTDADIPAVDPGDALNPREPPTVTGGAVQGDTDTCNPGRWLNGPTFTYQWLRDGTPILGATGANHVLTAYHDDRGHVINAAGDGDHSISCQVTGTNDLGSSAPVTSANAIKAVDAPPWPLTSPFVYSRANATAPLQYELDCNQPQWTDDYGTSGNPQYAYGYAWYRNGAAIANETAAVYIPTSDDFGREITCRATASNPDGTSTAISNTFNVQLPTGTVDTDIYREGGTNQVDPTNLMAISHAYRDAIDQVVMDRLQTGINSAVATCKTEIAKNHWGTLTGAPRFSSVADEKTRCFALVYELNTPFVKKQLDGGVRYNTGNCEMDLTQVQKDLGRVPACPSLGIEVSPINPLDPPAQDADLLAKIADQTPKEILWDLNGDGKTDAECPGSAPVLRTIFGWNASWHPRAVIINQQGQASHYGDVSFTLGTAQNAATIRSDQVLVCATSFDPPPDKSLPCITSGDIGRVHISNANLCPIDEREIDPADFDTLLPASEQAYLETLAEQRLLGEGTSTSRSAPDAMKTTWVGWDDDKPRAQARLAFSPGGLAIAGSEATQLSGTLADTTAALSSQASTLSYRSLTTTALHSVQDSMIKAGEKFVASAGGFAYNQIYVATGISDAVSTADGIATDITGGSVDLDGVTMNAVGNTAMLLVPSDVKEALPDVRDMTLAGRDIASQLGPAVQGQGIPLAVGGVLKTQLNDAKNAAADEVLRETNLDQMVDDATGDLKKKLQDALNIAPFKFLGDSTVKVGNDGTVTLYAHAKLPSLTGAGGSTLAADVTIHADPEGRISLDNIHVHADDAFLIGMHLHGVDVKYDHTTGVAITGTILFPQLANQGVAINRFALGPDGQFQDLNVDYLAGSGGGIPLGQGAYLTKLGFDANVAADVFSADATLAAGPSLGKGCPAVGANGKLTVTLKQPFALDADIAILAICVPLGTIHFHVDQTGLVELVGNSSIRLGPIHVSADLGAKFLLPNWQIWLDGDGGIDGLFDAQLHAVLSNIGIAGCGSLRIKVPIVSQISSWFGGKDVYVNISAGAGLDFGSVPPFSLPQIIANISLFTGCDIGHYYSLSKSRAAHMAAGSAGFDLPTGSGATLFSIEGAGAAPLVKLHSPDGKVLDFTDATGNTGKALAGNTAWGTVLKTEDRTVVIVPKPKSGHWAVEVAPGSPAVSRIRLAPILQPPAVQAKVTGHGATRVLHYRIYPVKGQSVVFRETAPGGGMEVIKTVTRGGTGTVPYTVSDATGTKRVVEADIFMNKFPRSRVIVARYTAASPPVGKATQIKVRRVGSHALITWHAAAQASTYQLAVAYGTGETIALTPRKGVLRASVPSVAKGEGLAIKIYAFSPEGRHGPVAKATLSGSMQVGAVKKAPPVVKKKTSTPKKKTSTSKKKS